MNTILTQNTINVYPNPSNLNGVYIAFPNVFESGKIGVHMVDIYGKVIFSKVYTLDNSNTPIYLDLEQIANGIYSLQFIYSNGQISAQKLTIIE